MALSSKGLAEVFDHDFVEKSNSGKTRSVREMEEVEKSVARLAARSLEEIFGDCHKVESDCTGSVETKPGIFGGVPAVCTVPCRQETGRTRGYEASFDGAMTAGLGSSSQGKFGALYSDSLLSPLRQRSDWVASSSMSSELAL